VSSLGSQISVRAHWQKRPVKAQGRLVYVRPDRLVFVLMQSGQKAVPVAEIHIQGGQLRIDPPAMAKGLTNLPLESLATLPKFFSGEITQPLDSPEVTTVADSDTIHYTSDSREAWMDSQRGMLTRYKGQNAQGGQDEIEVNSYSLVDGLWLPNEMHLRNRTRGWDARVRFSEWVINNPQSTQVPALPQ
jgi:hypothetical protein